MCLLRPVLIAVAVVHLLLISTITTPCALTIRTRKPAEEASFIPIAKHASQVAASSIALVGRFHIQWNGGVRYHLIDDEGSFYRLVMEETLLLQQGGALTLNRRRVKIQGRIIATDPVEIEVLSIARE